MVEISELSRSVCV